MRAAPAVQVSVARFGVWRGALVVALAAVWLSIGGWCAGHLLAQRWPAAAPVVAIGVSAALASGGFVARLARLRPFELRWDGRCWFLSDSGSGAVDPVPGDLHAAVDLDRWLLLRFVPERPAASPVRWLPVQRDGLDAAWHGLRCAVYSPRPTPADAASRATE